MYRQASRLAAGLAECARTAAQAARATENLTAWLRICGTVISRQVVERASRAAGIVVVSMRREIL